MNVAIIYFSSSGKTQTMAEMLAAELRGSGSRVLLTSLDEARESDFRQAELILIGSPAWTGEQVAPPMDEFVSASCSGGRCRKVAFFGSYDWGDGNYFDAFTAKLKSCGINVHHEQLLWAVNREELTREKIVQFLSSLLPQDEPSAAK